MQSHDASSRPTHTPIRLVWITQRIARFNGADSSKRAQAMKDIPLFVQGMMPSIEAGYARELAAELTSAKSARECLSKKSQFVLAYVGKQLVGLVTFRRDTHQPHEFIRNLMLVDPRFQNQRIAKRLHFAVSAYARRARATDVVSGAATHQGKHLIRLYERVQRVERRKNGITPAREKYAIRYGDFDLPMLRVKLIPPFTPWKKPKRPRPGK